MFPNLKSLVVIAACALAAQAQSSTTATAPASQTSLPAGIDTCILGCLTAATATGACSSYTDLQCVCTSTAFQSAALQCLQSNCTTDDVTAASQLQSQECASIVGNSSATSATPASTAASTSAASAAATTNAAVGLAAPFAFEAVFGTLLASTAALVGAAFLF
ncbi:hypothetical protein BU15DRAFT_64377 [Melanogaster broomeanus]|nr:hypothetical protein BU15DRAFT_64377 [Melanogaster broomeanus]